MVDKELRLNLLKAVLSYHGKGYDLNQVIENTNKRYEGVALYQVECNRKSNMEYPESYWDPKMYGE